MRLRLLRPLVILDVETTGTHPQVDRIVQLGLVKLYPNDVGAVEKVTEWETLINPTIPIPPEVTKVHGIADEHVRDAKTFRELAPAVAGGLMGCDLGGFNVRFDVLFLKKEFALVGGRSVLDGAQIVDPYRVFAQKEPHSLVAAVAHYGGDYAQFGPAHSALADARAAVWVLGQQLDRYGDLPDTVAELHKIYFEKIAEGHLDPDGKIAWRHGEATINFGKWATVPLKRVDRGYLEWIANGDFTPEVKRIVREALKGNYPKREEL